MTRSREAILRLFRVADNRAAQFEPQASIFPAYTAPVIRSADDGERELVTMSWGFVLLQPGKAPRRVTNVRDDKLLTSKFWKPSFEARRCIVPASSYCEPNGQSPATWFWFALNGDDERPSFAFPGIWQRWSGPVKKDGPNVEIDTYAFMTMVPNALTRSINHERMQQWDRHDVQSGVLLLWVYGLHGSYDVLYDTLDGTDLLQDRRRRIAVVGAVQLGDYFLFIELEDVREPAIGLFERLQPFHRRGNIGHLEELDE